MDVFYIHLPRDTQQLIWKQLLISWGSTVLCKKVAFLQWPFYSSG